MNCDCLPGFEPRTEVLTPKSQSLVMATNFQHKRNFLQVQRVFFFNPFWDFLSVIESEVNQVNPLKHISCSNWFDFFARKGRKPKKGAKQKPDKVAKC